LKVISSSAVVLFFPEAFEQLSARRYRMGTKKPLFEKMIKERDVTFPMRDGVKLAADIYCPDAPEGSIIYTNAMHNKDLQRPEMGEALNSQPAYSTMWYGVIEGGDTKRFVSNGYAHVIAQLRGVGKSEGTMGEVNWDHYDLIEWIAKQPWCDGNVGMVGISAFAGEQWVAASQQPPALKAIFPYDASGAYGGSLGFRELNPGGVIQTMMYHVGLYNIVHENRGIPPTLPPEIERLWEKALKNPDYMMYAHLWNILTQKGQRDPTIFYSLVFPYDTEENVRQSEMFKKIDFLYRRGAYAYTYKILQEHSIGSRM
jgi:hypothetical protein